MSLQGQSGVKSRAFYYVYIQNLPTKYVESEIFPEILLTEQVRESLLQMQMFRKEAYCYFGFNSKLISCKFQKQMQKYMPHFVLISRRKVEITSELKQQKEFFDSRTLNTSIDEEHPVVPKQQQQQQQQKSFSLFSFLSKQAFSNNSLAKSILSSFWKKPYFGS